MERQNITLSLPKSLLKKAKVMAVKKDKSLSEFFREFLEEKIWEDTGYAKARDRQLRVLRMGLNLGTQGNITVPREDLHARRNPGS